jgi:squalene-hopene/tetraprenyl-beta-curcumene cyclase
MLERFEESGGLGAILPAMMNSVLALRCLGYADNHPAVREGIRELEAFEIEQDDKLRIQPCVSPVWDTAISAVALGNSGMSPEAQALRKAADWLLTRQSKRPGDWHVNCPVPPGGWYFEFRNEFYPDVDDTAMVLMALNRAFAVHPESEKGSRLGKTQKQLEAEERGLRWMLAMQNEDGGWASFDRNNDKEFLTKIPFADHNAMIDPSTVDITARVLEAWSEQKDFSLNHPTVKKALAFIRKNQERDGSWYGRWGVNYLYGTWQVLRGLSKSGEDMTKGYVRKAVEWLKGVQLEDGGWGERADSYDDPSRKGKGPATPSQTAWAIMGLLAAGQGHGKAVRQGVRWLLARQQSDGTWNEEEWTGTGFPRVFYLRYHLYRHYFPLMALGQYEAFRRNHPRHSERLPAVK